MAASADRQYIVAGNLEYWKYGNPPKRVTMKKLRADGLEVVRLTWEQVHQLGLAWMGR